MTASNNTLPAIVREEETMFQWAYSGVDFSLANNGGEECVNFISTPRKITETILFILMTLVQIAIAYRKVELPKVLPPTERADRTGKRVMLLVMALVFGIELGFKFATRQMIWVLNPCHVVTSMQLYILIMPPCKSAIVLFRLTIHWIGGATVALLIPVVNTRLLPFEPETYYIQHIMMLIIPFYLLKMGGAYTTEPLLNFWWVLMACGLLFFYHWAVLQTVSLLTGCNLNFSICPATPDPFYGPWYRVCGMINLTLLVVIHGKLYTWVITRVLIPRPAPDVLPTNKDEELPEKNGYAKLAQFPYFTTVAQA